MTGLRLKSQRSVMNMTIYIRNGKKLKKNLEEFHAHRQENERRIDILEWELEQIRTANIINGEDEEIDRRLSILQNYEKINLFRKSKLFLLSVMKVVPEIYWHQHLKRYQRHPVMMKK